MSTTPSPALYAACGPPGSVRLPPDALPNPPPQYPYVLPISQRHLSRDWLAPELTTLAIVTRASFGVFGLAVMGQNLARNVASRGLSVAVYNPTPSRTEAMMSEHRGEGDLVPNFAVATFPPPVALPR